MFNEHLRLLGLYEMRLHYLETGNENLELCRVVKTMPRSEGAALIERYREHFKYKIQTIKFDIESLKNKNEEHLENYM